MRATASKSALMVSGCVTWMHPTAEWYDESKRKPEDMFARDEGTAFHESIDHVYNTGDASGVPAIVALRVGHALRFMDELAVKCPWLATELHVATNFVTGESFCDDTVRGRGYPNAPGYVHGTADVVGVTDDGFLYVGDWKTGGGNGAKEQLMTLGLGFRETMRRLTGNVLPLRLAVLYVHEHGVNPVTWEPNDDELLSHAFHMGLASTEPDPSRPAPSPGIHCTQLYCPHLSNCSAIAKVSTDASEGPNGLLPPRSLLRKYNMTDEPSSDEHAGFVMERVTAARRQLNYYEEGLRKYIANGGRVISGEYEWKKTSNGVRWSKAK